MKREKGEKTYAVTVSKATHDRLHNVRALTGASVYFLVEKAVAEWLERNGYTEVPV